MRLRTGLDGSVRKVTLRDGKSKLSLVIGLWGDENLFRRRLHAALVRHGVPGDHRELLRPPDLAVNLRLAGHIRMPGPG